MLISELQQARQQAKVFQATGLFPCDKNIFRPHDFPLASVDTDAASVNHPALVKTSDRPSFTSVNFSPFTSAEDLSASDISPVSCLNLKPNTHGGPSNKIPTSPYREFVGLTEKKKIKQATKSKTNWLASHALLGPSKRWNGWVFGDATSSDTPSSSDTDLAVPFDDDLMEGEEQYAGTDHLSEDHSIGEWIRWVHILCAGMEEVLVCVPCQG
jgi:hypothetical protein